ncbi:hypothetical protein F511_27178 [Dorcoceras hygrometricum]|uniref:Uncharacterized protein n=1 Tax=Dorcoceras hygrometricum TaxID=472368 RepID=A0A2Z7BZF7_9LAMI|nr:hypothetical protein F511_27178 [Dorcoceras hygrometricum]
MVVDLIGIYGLKGPYCTLTTTDWFLQALSVIPRGSWGDVARRFTMIRWASPEFTKRTPPPSLEHAAAAAATADRHRKIVSGQFDEENPFVMISSALLVQPDEGVSDLVVDRIGNNLPQSTEKNRIIVIPVGARHKCQQGNPLKRPISRRPRTSSHVDRPAPPHTAPPQQAPLRVLAALSSRERPREIAPLLDAGRPTLRHGWVNCVHWMREDRPCKARLSRDAAGRLAPPRAWIGDGPGAASCELSCTAVSASMIARWSMPPAAGREVLREVAARCCAQCALAARRCARRRALPPQSSWWWRRRRPPLRRCSGEFPAMS